MPLAARGERRIHWEEHGQGPTVLLVPGTGAGARQFGTLPRRFARHGIRCLSFTPVGIAPSSAAGGSFDFAEAARDLVAVLDAAGAEHCVPIGTSLGGKVALCACAADPARFRKLVMLASSALVTARARRVHRFFEVIADGLPADAFADAVAPFLLGRTFHEARPQVVDDLVRGLRPDAGARALMAAQARALQHFDGRELAARLTVPALCIAGSEDTLTPAAEVRATAALMTRARCVEIAEAGHSLLLESARAFDEVVAFALAP